MDLIPTIQLQNGHCVTLNKGRVEEPSIWHVDPVGKAQEFAAAGVPWIQVTDLDAVTGDRDNREIIEAIILGAGTSVQVAGGISTMERVAYWVEKGAGRVIIGSAGVTNPDFLKEAAKYYPDQIVLAVDVYQGMVSIDAWRVTTAFEPKAFIDEFAGAPLAAIKITDVHSDIGDVDGSIALVSGLAQGVRLPVIAGGLVRGADDVARLKYVPGIGAAMIGRALFEQNIDLTEAMAVASGDGSEVVAEFI
ncbi:MAG: 1-(5-phosphoribosyl)-5-((5-phosphoribosylamino)methylideneamino)imidazole-4-carboxamide isomerase [Marinosulfonomonas sp.]|nr:MAG: 1-(5-phosphoribosyl)-5-((5-phosphoribosylamino)methylideneamino)imidazole-4-carboxamide isomerase [Marinosulfonomonas sp.]